MDYIQIAISARLAHGDLVAADAALETGPTDPAVGMLLIKQLLIACANVTDLEGISRALYKDHPELNKIVDAHRRGFAFAKYLRNIAVGHVNPALCHKAVEWRPELNAVLAHPKPGTDLLMAYAVLETAINTYVDRDRHKIFDSDTDLIYSPDRRRFLNYLGEMVHAAIAYCAALAAVAVGYAGLPDFPENMLDLAAKAGRTDFKFITKQGESA